MPNSTLTFFFKKSVKYQEKISVGKNLEKPKRTRVLLGSVLLSFLATGSVRVLDSWVPVRVPLLQKIWNEQTLPKDWLHGIIIKIPKKGDLSNCKNCRGIT
jgi:hypothetical protein